MSQAFATTTEYRAAAARMVAVAEYFKVFGDLPPWARAELESRTAPATGAGQKHAHASQPSQGRRSF